MKHTNGGWEVSSNSNQGLMVLINQHDARSTTNICSISGSTSSAETLANAKLIAAAPELLEALIELKKAGLGCYGKKEQEMVINAIKKAIL